MIVLKKKNKKKNEIAAQSFLWLNDTNMSFHMEHNWLKYYFWYCLFWGEISVHHYTIFKVLGCIQTKSGIAEMKLSCTAVLEDTTGRVSLLSVSWKLNVVWSTKQHGGPLIVCACPFLVFAIMIVFHLFH